MEKSVDNMRGLINDLTRTLSRSLVHMDNLLLQLDSNSDDFNEALLANDQIERSLEFFIELRSEYMIYQDLINRKKANSCALNVAENLLHNINNLLAAIVGYCDLIENDVNNLPMICQITKLIFKSVHNSTYIPDKSIKSICLSDQKTKDGVNRLNLHNRTLLKSKTKSDNKTIINNSILLVEDDEQVKNILTIMLRNNKFNVVGCSKGIKALAKFEKLEGKFIICIVDVGLPDIKGPDLVKIFLSQKPDINVIFTSGYSENKLKKQFPLMKTYPILIKPFGMKKLLHAMGSMITY